MPSAVSARPGLARCPSSVVRQRASVDGCSAPRGRRAVLRARVSLVCSLLSTMPSGRAAVCTLKRAAVTHPRGVRSRRDRARARRAANVGWCACGAPVRVDGFRDRPAYREFFRSGLCQDCQDRVFLSFDETNDSSHAVRRGLVAGSQVSAGAVAALPFLFTRPGRPIAWEPRHCVLVGPEGSPCDPWGDLEPMADLLIEHQIRVHEADAADDPAVSECLGVPAVVLAPDRVVLDVCTVALGISDEVLRVVLADAFPWTDLCGVALTPLPRFALRAGFSPWRERDAGALRRCAWLGAALALPVPRFTAGATVMDAVLSACTHPPSEVAS